MPKFVVTGFDGPEGLGVALCRAAGVDPNYVSRLVLDLKVGHAGRLYLECFADNKALEVELPTAEVTIREVPA